MDVYLSSCQHRREFLLTANCSEHNLFGSLPATMVGKYLYTVKTVRRFHSFRSDNDHAYFTDLIRNIS